MASPHVAGLAAYLMSLDGNLTTSDAPSLVSAKLKSLAASTGAAVTGANSNTTTLIAYNGDGF